MLKSILYISDISLLDGSYLSLIGGVLLSALLCFFLRKYYILKRGYLKNKEEADNYQNVIYELNSCLELGNLIRWRYNLETNLNQVSDKLGGKYEFSNEEIVCIHKGSKRLFLRYLLNLLKGELHLPNIDLWVYSKHHNMLRLYRLKAQIQTNKEGKAQYISGIWRDITEDAEKLNKIEEMQRNMSMALEVGKVETWKYDCAKKLYTVIHGEPIGIDCPEGMSLEYFLKHIHPEDREVAEEFSNKVISQKLNSANYKFRFKTAKGWRWIHNSYVPIITNGKVTSILGVRRDITDDLEYSSALENRLVLVQERTDDLLRILDYLPVPIALKNIQNNTYTYVNKMGKELYGIAQGNTPSYTILSTSLDGDIEQIKRSGFYEAEECLLLSNGYMIETMVKSINLKYKDTAHALISRVDLTDYNKAKKDATLLTTFMPAIKAYSWYYHSRNNVFTIQHNMELERDINGTLTPAEFLEVVHPEDRELVLRKIKRALIVELGVSWSFQFRMDIERKGVYEWWQTNHAVDAVIDKGIEHRLVSGLTINVNDKKKSELELEKLKNEIELILNNANSLLAYVSSDYEIIWSNADVALDGRLKSMYNAGMKCCLGYGCLTRGYKEACDVCPIRITLATGKLSDKEFLVEDGKWLRTTAIPIQQSSENPNGVILRIDDVSEYKTLIGQLEVTTQKAEEADRLKSAFLANMSHEIRTPLNAIVGFSELLQSADDVAERDEYIRIINSNNDLLLRLIGDILDLSKIESGSIELSEETFDFSAFIKETYHTLKPRCEKSEVELKLLNPFGKCIVTLDKNRVLQILTNYLNNAVKFTQQGQVTLGYDYQDNGLLLFVEDTGIGISEEKMHLLFQRFEKLDDFAQGTGLGLSICKAIADTMGGKVWAESKDSEGSTFFAWLPCSSIIEEANLGKQNEYDIDVEFAINERIDVVKNILVAEDNDSNYMLVRAILKGFNLTRAMNGEEAVAYAKQHKYDAILMDMKMPVMGGLEATRKIREFDLETIIVAVTANAFDSDKTDAIRAGCNTFIPKPIRKTELESAICGGGVKSCF